MRRRRLGGEHELRKSYEPEFKTSDYQRSVAGELNVQAQSYSAFKQDGGNLINWNGDRRVNHAYYGAQPPGISAVVHVNNSATRFNGYKEAPQYFGVAPRVKTAQGPNLSAVLRRNYSATGFHDDDGYGQAPSYSAVAPRNSSVPGVVNMYYAARLNGYELMPPSFSDMSPLRSFRQKSRSSSKRRWFSDAVQREVKRLLPTIIQTVNQHNMQNHTLHPSPMSPCSPSPPPFHSPLRSASVVPPTTGGRVFALNVGNAPTEIELAKKRLKHPELLG
ncbi:hypothetical protein E3N88_24103 [Mikania micrantha]|uniref:Uncharacterized protein n=1 Tax=Mikania micrantha TaxID=192012 RepID=A0A5N6NF59_9ASTR|nr:hypothetical protein E3N88_24103 [Mikania micrantha]